jgi:hypothetical protein
VRREWPGQCQVGGIAIFAWTQDIVLINTRWRMAIGKPEGTYEGLVRAAEDEHDKEAAGLFLIVLVVVVVLVLPGEESKRARRRGRGR